MKTYLLTVKDDGQHMMIPALLQEIVKCQDIYNLVMYATAKYPEKDGYEIVQTTLISNSNF